MICDSKWIEADRTQGIELSVLRKLIGAAPAGSINLALGELGYTYPESLREQAISILEAGSPQYTPNAGLPLLREAISLYDKTGGCTNEICVCNGVEEALFISLQTILNPGDVIAIPDPDYSAYPALVKLVGAKIERLPLSGDLKSIMWDEWISVLGSGVKVLLLSHPSNPAGYTFSEEDLRVLQEILNRNEIILIVDEIYQQLYLDTPWELDFSGFNRVIRVSGVSKSHLMSGWRIGWIIAPEAIMKSMVKVKQYVSTCSSWVSQKLTIYALQDISLQQYVRNQLRRSREVCLNLLNHSYALSSYNMSNVHSPMFTPYIMLKVKDTATLTQSLLKRGVIIVPGDSFGSVSKDWIRINHAVEEDKLHAAIRILVDELDSL